MKILTKYWIHFLIVGVILVLWANIKAFFDFSDVEISFLDKGDKPPYPSGYDPRKGLLQFEKFNYFEMPSNMRRDDSKSKLTDYEADELGDKLYKTFVWTSYDKDHTWEILNSISEHDYNKIYNHFGLRLYNKYTGDKFLFANKKRDLDFIMANELNQLEQQQLQQTVTFFLF